MRQRRQNSRLVRVWGLIGGMSTEQGSGDLTARVAALEKANSHLKVWIALAGAVFVVGLWMMFSRVPGQLQTRQLIVRDTDNQVRAVVGEDGVTLYDASGGTRARMYVSEDAAGVAFLDAERANRAQLAVQRDGTGILEIPNATTATSARTASK